MQFSSLLNTTLVYLYDSSLSVASYILYLILINKALLQDSVNATRVKLLNRLFVTCEQVNLLHRISVALLPRRPLDNNQTTYYEVVSLLEQLFVESSCQRLTRCDKLVKQVVVSQKQALKESSTDTLIVLRYRFCQPQETL